MAGLFDLEEHLVFYRSYHFNHVNVTIHLMCIPMILLSVIAFSSPVNLVADKPYINLGSILAFTYGMYYVLLDYKVGIPSFSVLMASAYMFKHYYLGLMTPEAQHEFVKWSVGLHVLSWIAQFYGHGVHEKRAPALLDNLLQALVLAPFFVAYEVAFWLGYKPELKKSMDNKAAKLILKFRHDERAKKA